jgi:hypothetical protein
VESNHRPQHYQVCAGKPADQPHCAQPLVSALVILTNGDP